MARAGEETVRKLKMEEVEINVAELKNYVGMLEREGRKVALTPTEETIKE